jgi:hypothetical protein
VKFKRGDRVRDVDHGWTPTMAEFGTVDRVNDVGAVYVDWDDAGPDLIPADPATLALAK